MVPSRLGLAEFEPTYKWRPFIRYSLFHVTPVIKDHWSILFEALQLSSVVLDPSNASREASSTSQSCARFAIAFVFSAPSGRSLTSGISLTASPSLHPNGSRMLTLIVTVSVSPSASVAVSVRLTAEVVFVVPLSVSK